MDFKTKVIAFNAALAAQPMIQEKPASKSTDFSDMVEAANAKHRGDKGLESIEEMPSPLQEDE